MQQWSVLVSPEDTSKIVDRADRPHVLTACRQLPGESVGDQEADERQSVAFLSSRSLPLRSLSESPDPSQHHEARKICPDLVIVHVASLKIGEGEANFMHRENPSVKTHKVRLFCLPTTLSSSHLWLRTCRLPQISLEPYRRASDKIIKLFQRSVPDGEIGSSTSLSFLSPSYTLTYPVFSFVSHSEKASIDEAFLDLTIPVRKLLLARYPHLAQPPPSSPLGLDTPLPPPPELDWNSSDWGVPLSALGTEGQQPSGGWPDVALWLGGELMERVRGEVETELGYTTSAGISHSKILAKVCSAYKKPSAQVSPGPKNERGDDGLGS